MQLDKDLEDLDEEYQKNFQGSLINVRKEYEYMISDEHTIEIFEANEYEFTEEGKIK